MKRHMRLLRTAVVGGASLALTLSLAGCGGSGDGAGGDSDTIRVLVYGDATNKVEKQLVDTFNKT
ncbi:sugar-binding protein, partial [Streptomyces roseolus]